MELSDKYLLQECRQVTEINKEFIDQMHEFMKESGGIGLAANQVGSNEMIFVMSPYKQNSYTMINPKIISVSNDMIDFEEGCLSYPDVKIIKKRHKIIKLEYTNSYGNKRVKTFKRLAAIVVQHEISHLNGISFKDGK